MGKNFYDLNYPDDLAARLQRQIQQVFDTRQNVRDETPYSSPTGVDGYYEYIFCPVLEAVSIGRRNTQLEPTLHGKQKLKALAGLGHPKRYPG